MHYLISIYSALFKKDKLILTGDFNARVGCQQDKWESVIGPHGTGKCNSDGELLLALSSEYGLVITYTIFMHREHHKVTWMHSRSRHWHLLVYNTAEIVCGKPKRKHQDWFDETDKHLNDLQKQRNNG